MKRIDLTWPEVMYAAQVGVRRQLANLRDNRQQRHGAECAKDGPFQSHISGAIGECGIAKDLNIFWSGAIGDFTAKDVGSKVQVRATEHASGRLVLHPDDAAADLFICARVILRPGAVPHVIVPGWITCGDGKRQEYWLDPQGKGRFAFFVDNAALHPLDTCPVVTGDKSK